MRIPTLTLALLATLAALPSHAAVSTDRTYANPACSERNANPENCVIQDGVAPRRPPVSGTTPGSPGGGVTPPAPAPDGGNSFTPKGEKGKGGIGPSGVRSAR